MAEGCSATPFLLNKFLQNREFGRNGFLEKKQLKLIENHVVRLLPPMLREKIKFPCIEWKFDKIFASEWLDEDTIYLGTKCNQLIKWDLKASTRKTTSSSSTSTSTTNSSFLSNDSNASVILEKHNNPINFIELPKRSPSSAPLAFECGIHFISFNNSKTILASGGDSPADIGLFELPSHRKIAMLEGHNDWVFGSAFLNDDVLVSCSRDSSVKLWRVSSPSKATLTRFEHTQKVREIKYCKWMNCIATVSQDGFVKIWDPENLDVISSVQLPQNKDIVSMAFNSEQNLLAVGEQNNAFLIDVREPNKSKVSKLIPSNDTGFGVRSLSWPTPTMLAIGGGSGRLSFFDLESNAFIPISPTNYTQQATPTTLTNYEENISLVENQQTTTIENTFLKAGIGYLQQDENFHSYFSTSSINNAIYSHSLSPSKTKILIAGGPLVSGLKGSYAAVWM